MLGPGEEKAYSKDWNLTYESGDHLPPGIYQLKAIIKASITIESELIDIVVQGHQQDILLYKGWNFISLPCIPVYSDMSIIMKSIWSFCKSVWAYNSGTKYWLRYVASDPYYLNNLKTMEIGVGYWIEVSQDVVLNIVGKFVQNPRIQLRPGWNLVGFSSSEPLLVDQAMSSILYRSIHAYNSMDGKWASHAPVSPQLLNGLDYLEPGKGYCIYVDDYYIWDIRNSF